MGGVGKRVVGGGRGTYLDEVDPTEERGSSVPGHVPNDPPTQGDEGCAAI